jgi:peptide/nickel transport system permease protein
LLFYVIRRLASALVVVVGVVTLTFLITRIVPNDPAATWAGPHANAAEVARAAKQLGLNHPLWYQLTHYLGDLFSGNWGVSLTTHRAVLSDLLRVIPASLELVIASLVIALLVGVPLGLVSARFSGRSPDHVVRVAAVFGASMPAFWLAVILQLFLFGALHILPVAGDYNPALTVNHPLAVITGAPIVDSLLTGNWPVFASSVESLILPAIAIALYPTAVIARMIRATVQEQSAEPHAQMARALGFPERVVLTRFCLRLAWNPILQILALVFAYALVNTFLVESVFDWPGLGSYAANAITSLDTPAITGITVFVAIAYVLCNLAVDLLQAALDPRIRLR